MENNKKVYDDYFSNQHFTYPKGVCNGKLGLAVQESGAVADGTLDHTGRALATGNGCGWWRGKWRGCGRIATCSWWKQGCCGESHSA